ncbi:MAG TPA: hypothetical protein DEH22_06700, partial [Chloroflexi bacterium]|nr:hypothetical protein [Chloroflexota bacterium]
MIILGLTLILMAASVQAFPDWASIPGGLLLLFGVAFKAVLEIPGKLKDWLELLEGKQKADKTETAPNSGTQIEVSGGQPQINTAEGGRNIQTEQYFEGGEHQHIYPAPDVAPKPHGFIPHQEIYIPRGQIEADVRGRLAAQGVAAVVGLHAPGGGGKTEL